MRLSYSDHPPPKGHERLLDGQLQIALDDPAFDPEAWPGYAIWKGHLYRNGVFWGAVRRYWWDRNALGWWVEYRPQPAARRYLRENRE